MVVGICAGTAPTHSGSLFPIDPTSGPAGTNASLFPGRDRGFFEQPLRLPDPLPASPAAFPMAAPYGGPVAALRDLIAEAEAGPEGYDAVQWGARIRPDKRPTAMTLGEIFTWIDATPGQPHAIGRYQFIPDTLDDLVTRMNLPPETRFDPTLQDLLADSLLDEAGLQDFLSGRMGRTAFMNEIAQIWAGFPTSSGRSYYHGYAGNKATMSLGRFRARMTAIFPTG